MTRRIPQLCTCEARAFAFYEARCCMHTCSLDLDHNCGRKLIKTNKKGQHVLLCFVWRPMFVYCCQHQAPSFQHRGGACASRSFLSRSTELNARRPTPPCSSQLSGSQHDRIHYVYVYPIAIKEGPGLRRVPEKGGGSFARPSIASMSVGAQSSATAGVSESKKALGVALCVISRPS